MAFCQVSSFSKLNMVFLSRFWLSTLNSQPSTSSRRDVLQKFELPIFNRDDDRGLRGVALGINFGPPGSARNVGGCKGVTQFRGLGRARAFDRIGEHQRGVVAQRGHGIGNLAVEFGLE